VYTARALLGASATAALDTETEESQSTDAGRKDNRWDPYNRRLPHFHTSTASFAAPLCLGRYVISIFCCVSRCIYAALGARFLIEEPRCTFFHLHKERGSCTVGPGHRQSQLWHVGARVVERDPTALTMTSRWPWRLESRALTRFRGPERRRWQTYGAAASRARHARRPNPTQVSSPLPPLPKQKPNPCTASILYPAIACAGTTLSARPIYSTPPLAELVGNFAY
jgi:hypothetical protein